MGFFTLAWLQSESRKGGYAMLVGFLFLMAAGMLTAAFGLEYRDGYTIDDTVTPNVIDYVYISLDTTEQFIVSLPLIISGLWGVVVVGLAIREDRSDERYA